MDNIPIIDLSDFKKIEKLGFGKFGEVFLICHRKTSLKYVAKVFKTENQSEKLKGDLLQELLVYSKTENPSVLSIYGYSFTDFNGKSHPTIILDYMPNKSLQKHLNNLSPTKRYIILLGTAAAMKYLHSQNIIHRDIKSDNILLDSYFYPKICDFGISVAENLELSEIRMNQFAGTPLYMAPEIYNDEIDDYNYNYKVDVYSFGILAYELISGKEPFKGYTNKYSLMKDVRNGLRPNLSAIKSTNIQSLLKKCWSPNPSERPEFEEIVKEIKSDKFYSNLDEKEITTYLNYFYESIKNPFLSQQLNIRKAADEGNMYSMFFHGLILNFQNNDENSIKYIKNAADLKCEDAALFYAIEKNVVLSFLIYYLIWDINGYKVCYINTRGEMKIALHIIYLDAI